MIRQRVRLASIEDAEHLHSERARGILRQALNLERSTSGDQDHFVAELGSEDYEICKALVVQGLMVQLTPIGWPAPPTFRLTEMGRQIALEGHADA